MTQTTPAQERYTRFSCPNPACTGCNRPGAGHIAHRSWTGTHQHLAQLRCTACGREFSERAGTLLARSKLPEDTVVRLLQCQRWGVFDAGTADMWAVEFKTGHRLQQVAAPRAETHYRQVAHEIDVPGGQLEEAHSKLHQPQPRLVPSKPLCYAQVVKVRNATGGGWWRSAGATRCLSWSPARHRGRLWLTVSLYNFVMPHKSL